MPGLDGLACLDRIMLDRPTPVVMVSSLTADGAEVTLDAMERGAVDFVAKPGGAVSLEIDRLGPLIVQKVRAAAGARLRPTLRLAETHPCQIRRPAEAACAVTRLAFPRASSRELAEPMAGPVRRHRARRDLDGRAARARCLAVAAARRLSLAGRGRAAHARQLHRPPGAPARRPLRPAGAGGLAADAAGSRQRLRRQGRRGRDARAPSRRAGGAACPGPRRVPLASERRPPRGERHGARRARAPRRRPDDRHGPRRGGDDDRAAHARAAAPSPRARRRLWSGACRASSSKPAAPRWSPRSKRSPPRYSTWCPDAARPP